jgi:WD40 repeat protein
MEPEEDRVEQSSWVLQYAVAESHGKPVYGAAFAPIACLSSDAVDSLSDDSSTEKKRPSTSDSGPEKLYLLATCGGPGVRVYSAASGGYGSQDLQLLVSFASPASKSRAEDCYTCAWAIEEETGDNLLCMGYDNGIIRVIHLRDNTVRHTFLGHSGAVNFLTVNPRRPSWLLSASKDESLRLWDLKTGHCFAIFCGLQGHRGEVLFCEWHHSGERFLSCGMDCTIREWSVPAAAVEAFEKQRQEYQRRKRTRKSEMHQQVSPIHRLHRPLRMTNATPQRILFQTSRPGAEEPSLIQQHSENDVESRAANETSPGTPEATRGPRSKRARIVQNSHRDQAGRISTATDVAVSSRDSSRQAASTNQERHLDSNATSEGGAKEHGSTKNDVSPKQSTGLTSAALTEFLTEDKVVSPPVTHPRSSVEFVQFPNNTFCLVHGNYVDCAMYVGDLILSKSVHNKIVLWAPGADTSGFVPSSIEHHVIVEYRYPGGDLWYMRFALNPSRTLLAVGSRDGRIYLFDVDDPKGMPAVCLTHPQAKSAVRQLAFSPDGRILVAVCDDSTVWRWDTES